MPHYNIPRQMRSGKLPESDRHTLTPKYLLGHENRFDPNVFTPEQMIQKGILRGKPAPVQQI